MGGGSLRLKVSNAFGAFHNTYNYTKIDISVNTFIETDREIDRYRQIDRQIDRYIDKYI